MRASVHTNHEGMSRREIAVSSLARKLGAIASSYGAFQKRPSNVSTFCCMAEGGGLEPPSPKAPVFKTGGLPIILTLRIGAG